VAWVAVAFRSQWFEAQKKIALAGKHVFLHYQNVASETGFPFRIGLTG
jgi:hypothetical protein